MYEIIVNMVQFKQNWKDYQDNIKYAEAIRNNNGHILTLNPQPYIDWLNDFNITYNLVNAK